MTRVSVDYYYVCLVDRVRVRGFSVRIWVRKKCTYINRGVNAYHSLTRGYGFRIWVRVIEKISYCSKMGVTLPAKLN